MKYLVGIVCSLMLVGCGDSAPSQAPSASETQPPAVSTPAAEANVSETAPAAEKMQPQAPANPPAAAPVAPPSAGVEGSTLFAQKCASCHGSKAEKSALGKSQVIAGWSDAKVKEALKGYQNGTYGKEMKALMQGQAKSLDEAQINALAHHISSL